MRRLLMLWLAALLLLLAGHGHSSERSDTHMADAVARVRADTDAMFDGLVATRRDLHRQPELAGREARTSALVATRLRALGLEVRTGLYGHSVVGILRGAHPGDTIAWRSELDALPGESSDPASFASNTPGAHHGCGHDVHIAIALGIAEILAKRRDQLHGTAIFVFQPEEETFKGAKGMIERGLFEGQAPDEIYALHVTAFPVGQVVVRPNEMFAHERRVGIRLRNALSVERVEALKAALQRALWRTAPNAKPWELSLLVDPAQGLTAPETSFRDYSILGGGFDTRTEQGDLLIEANVYETSAANIEALLPTIERAVEAAGEGQALRSLTYAQANPTVLNAPALTEHALQVLRSAWGEASATLSHGQVPYFNDDFAYFQREVPGVYFFLGGSNFEKGVVAMNHAPNFQVDEQALRVGVERFSLLMLDRLGAGSSRPR